MSLIWKIQKACVTLLTSLFLFHLISFSPHFIVPVSSHFLQSTLHWPCFIFNSHSPSHSSHLPQSISFMFTLFGCIHITWSLNLIVIVSFIFHSILSLEINDWQVSLDKFLILDRYSLLESDLRCFYYFLSLYIKQEIQHGVRRNVLVCSAPDVYLLIYSTQAYVGKR